MESRWTSKRAFRIIPDASTPKGLVHGVAAGTATIKATYVGYKYQVACQPQPCTGGCIATPVTDSGSSTCDVKPTVTIATQANSNPYVFVGTTDNTVTQYNTQLAVGIPNGGTYTWSVSPESVTITPNGTTDAYLPTFTGSTPSQSAGSTTETVNYTVNSEPANPASRAVTLRKFSSLTTPSTKSGCPDDPDAPSPGLGYLAKSTYNILSTPGAEQVQTGFGGMTVGETVTVTSVTPSTFKFTPVTQTGATTTASKIIDCQGIPSSTALPSNLVVCATQTMSVGGIQVRSNTLKYTNTSVNIVSTCP